MQLYIQQKVFSWNDKFFVKDEKGNNKYFVEGEFFSFGKKLHIKDLNGKEVAMVHQKVWSFMPKFYIVVDGEQVAEIIKEITFFKPKYSISGLDWRIEGDYWCHNYQIIQSGHEVVSIQKEWLTWGDCYVLNIVEEVNESMALAVVLAIDCVMEQTSTVAGS